MIAGEKHTRRVTELQSLRQISSYILTSTDTTTTALQEALTAYVTAGWLAELLHHELDAMRADKHYIPIRSYYSGLEIMDNELFTLQLIHVSPVELRQRTLLTAFSDDKVIMSLCSGGLKYACYTQTKPEPVELLEPDRVLQVVTTEGKMDYLESKIVRRYRDVFSYTDTFDGTNIIALVATVKAEPGFDWEYDGQSLRPQRLVGDPSAARLEHTCRMLGELGNPESITVLKQLLHNPRHNVRWEAARSIMLLDTDEGISALNLLSDDPHPDIRAAVNKSLTQLAMLS